MAEIIGVVSGGMGVASFAGEIVDNIIKLKAFWDKVKDAPAQIVYVLEELETYSELLSEIEKQNGLHDLPDIGIAAITKSTKLCRNALDVLTEILRDVELESRRHRFRGGIKFVLKEASVDAERARLEYARNLLHTSYTVYCTALNRHQIELQRKAVELQQKTIDLQLSISDSTNTKLINLETTVFSISSTKASERNGSMDLTIKPGFQTSETWIPIEKATWMEYFMGSVSYRRKLHAASQNGSRDPIPQSLYFMRIRIPGWWKAQVWDIHVSHAMCGWINYLQIYNIVPSTSPQFRYAIEGKTELLRDIILSRGASPTDRDENGYSLLYYAVNGSQPDSCQLLLDIGGFEQERGFCGADSPMIKALKYASSALDSYRPSPQSTTRAEECFEILLNHSEPVLTDDDIDINPYADYRMGLSLRSLRTLFSHRSYNWGTESLERRLTILDSLVRAKTTELRDDIDQYINVIYFALGSHDIEVNDQDTSDQLRLFIPIILDLMIRSAIENHANGIREARRFMKIAVDSGSILITNASMLVSIWSYFWFSTNISTSDLQEVLQVWTTELCMLGVDLVKYGQQQKLIQPSLSHCFRFYGKTRITAHQNICPGNEGLLFSYGHEPVHWKLYVINHSDEFAGAFWCVVENPPLKIPGSWEEDEDVLYEDWESQYWNDEALGIA